MLYHLMPPNCVSCAEMPTEAATLHLLAESADLADLNWIPAEDRGWSSNLLKLALRRGVASRSGIVISAADVADLDQGDIARLIYPGIHERHEAEGFVPPESYDVDGLVDALTSVAQAADHVLSLALAMPAQPALVAHWRALGGVVPD